MGLIDVILAVVFLFIFTIVAGVMIFVSSETGEQFHSVMDNMSDEHTNYTTIIQETQDEVTASFRLMYWLVALMFVGQIIGIWVGAYIVKTKPVFFVVHIFISIIEVIFAVVISNAYEVLRADATIGATFSGFTFLNNVVYPFLPYWVVVISFIGAIIMYARYTGGEDETIPI